jgi:hemolysin III
MVWHAGAAAVGGGPRRRLLAGGDPGKAPVRRAGRGAPTLWGAMDRLEEVIPRLRGVLHAYAFWFALAAAALLVALAPDGRARVAAAVYGLGLCALFAASGLYHRWRWSPRWKPLLRRLDHATIYLFIASSCTPVALLVLHGTLQTVVLASVWAGAALGIGFALAWIDAPRVLVAGTYLAVGWVAAIAVPQVLNEVGVAPFALFVAGGVLYSVGATVYAARRPDPWPSVFGFHEVFHALVIAAAIVHFVAMAAWVVPRG